MTESIESRRRSRLVRIGSTVGVVIAAALVVWGFSRGNDDRSPDTTIPAAPSTIGAIGAPGVVLTTSGAAPVPTASPPDTADVPTIPVGTADVALPPLSTDVPAP